MVGYINKNPVAQLLSYPNVTSGLLSGNQRCLIFDRAGDPTKTQRCRIRMAHWNPGEMPDDKCPWVPVSTSTNSQTSSSTHSMYPGQMAWAWKTDDQNWCINGNGAIGNDNTDANASQPPASGPDMKDTNHSAQQWMDRTCAWGMQTREVLTCNNSILAMRIRDAVSKKPQRQAKNQYDETVQKHHTLAEYNRRKPARDAYETMVA